MRCQQPVFVLWSDIWRWHEQHRWDIISRIKYVTHAHEEGFCIAEGVCPYLKGDQCELGDNRPIKCTDRFKALDASLEKDARDLFIDIRNTFITHYEEIYIITLFASQVLDGLFVLDEKTGKYDLTEKGRKFFKSDIPYLT